MLTPLQVRVAEIIADLDEAKDFALAGGAALIARGEIQRQTRDLDFFGLTAEAVDRLVPATMLMKLELPPTTVAALDFTSKPTIPVAPDGPAGP